MTVSNQEKIDYLLSLEPQDTGPSNEQKQEFLTQLQQPEAQVTQVQDKPIVTPQEQHPVPVVTAGSAVTPKTDSDGAEVSPYQNLSIDIYTAMAAAGVNVYNQSQEIGDSLMSKWQGEMASIPSAMKGAEFAAKLPIGHPLLKGLAVAAGSAVGAGVGTVFGELGEDVYNGTPLEYSKALEEGVSTAQWDLAGGLVLKGLGTITSKALRSAGITSTGDAVKAARELLQRHGTDLSWHQATGSTLSSLVEGIAVVGIGGRTLLDKAFDTREKALKKELDTFFSGGDQQHFGRGLVNIVKKSNKILRDIYNPQYAHIYEQGKDIPVYALSYNNKIQKQIAARHGAEKADTAVEPNKLIKGAQGVLTNLKRITTVSELSDTIKKLNFIKRQANDLSKTVEGKETGGAAATYIETEIKELRSMLGEAAKDLKPDLKNALDYLDMSYARHKALLHSQTMKEAMTKKPSEIGALIYNSPETAGDFMRFLGTARRDGAITKTRHKQILAQYRSGYIKTLLKVEGEGSNVVEMAGLYSKLRSTKERAQLKAILGGPQTARLLTVLKTADIVKQHEAGKFGLLMSSGLARSAQAASKAGLALTMGGAGGLSALLLAPQALARAAGSAQTLGQWLSLNKMYKSASKSGSRDAMALASKRILEWSNAEPEEEIVRTGARQLPPQPQVPKQGGMLTGAR